MAITYFGTAASPADNGTQDGSAARSVTPPGSMTAGDLVVMVGQYHNNDGSFPSIQVSETGGQTWNHIGGPGSVDVGWNVITEIYWCRFNGSWEANPSMTFGGASSTNAASVLMHVFRPTSSAYTWATDAALMTGSWDETEPLEVTITGRTTLHASTVSLGMWFVGTTTRWSSPTGWTQAGGAQYRNKDAPGGQSATFQYKILTSIGATGDCSETQDVEDQGVWGLQTWYESLGALKDPIGRGVVPWKR